ncbi:hypothetical protein CGLO_14037 [Colletotrichum gloeosporioides Cg-14]|uniref:Uncharacterized protein n=1 Tax=Colletotrichum gloeosporioides (strain Cg-14) TaxID=1237896 RepID=T0L5N7_COLGC|nr:hypothetical protein CGLO_14037 [Colletotrichum gloeosporioides Cg-14]
MCDFICQSLFIDCTNLLQENDRISFKAVALCINFDSG